MILFGVTNKIKKKIWYKKFKIKLKLIEKKNNLFVSFQTTTKYTK